MGFVLLLYLDVGIWLGYVFLIFIDFDVGLMYFIGVIEGNIKFEFIFVCFVGIIIWVLIGLICLFIICVGMVFDCMLDVFSCGNCCRGWLEVIVL